MGFDAFNQLFIHRRAIARCSKCPVIAKAPRAACNLRRFHRREVSASASVIFGEASKGDMICIKVKPHANSVSCDKEIDIAALKHLGLRVAGAR